MPSPKAFTKVCVQVPQWGSLTFMAKPEDRVKQIHLCVREKTKIPMEDQTLFKEAKKLKPQRSLSAYGIEPQTTVHLTLKVVRPSPEPVDVTLVDSRHEGQTYPLQVRRTDSVAAVQKMIQEKTEVPPQFQVVICNGKRLEAGKTMAEYGTLQKAVFFITSFCQSG
ncbi:ubiquitin D [Ornithorhynchus anatinus]|uniref:Ubiquitin D n=1 Tax=Ornithorhynchus anatinus TaxID=9258 RepID=F6WF43_ORNAN|nr:ubiquitin D [Ornithorhynchus anatinus]